MTFKKKPIREFSCLFELNKPFPSSETFQLFCGSKNCSSEPPPPNKKLNIEEKRAVSLEDSGLRTGVYSIVFAPLSFSGCVFWLILTPPPRMQNTSTKENFLWVQLWCSMVRSTKGIPQRIPPQPATAWQSLYSRSSQVCTCILSRRDSCDWKKKTKSSSDFVLLETEGRPH